MVLDSDGEPLLTRVIRRPLRHRPGFQDTVNLEPEVVMLAARQVLLDNDDRLTITPRRCTVRRTKVCGAARLPGMAAIRCGPARVPSRESPVAAAELLVERGYAACEVDFEGGFWMNWSYAEQFGASARERDIRLSLHAPIPAFVGHPERGKKYRMAVGMLDHSAGIAVACGAEPVVIHPGFLFGRERRDAIAAVIEQLQELRTRLEPKGRAVSFGVEVMGRARELGTLDDVLAISSQVPWVRPVLDFAHLHAVTGGGLRDARAFERVLAGADAVMAPALPFHIHFSDVTFANRNEKAHVPYGHGTLRAEPLADALASFDRPATVIGESPDEPSNQAIRALLLERPAAD